MAKGGLQCKFAAKIKLINEGNAPLNMNSNTIKCTKIEDDASNYYVRTDQDQL